MKILLLLTSLVVLADCKALISEVDTQPRCIKIDECSCRLKNVQEPGLINLHDLVSDNEPRFVTEGRSEQTGLVYTFYYNPCKNFLDLVCPNTSICQKDQNAFYDLGNLNTAEFEYQNNSVIVVYKSSQHYNRINRTSEVELICDEYEVLGRFEYVGEPVQAHYKFKLYTQCACPGKCKVSKVECVGQDVCTCEMSDGNGTINLHSLDNLVYPMKDEPNPKQTIFYNPCSQVAYCHGYSICELHTGNGSIVGLGFAWSAKFVSNGNQHSIKYHANVGRSSSTVNLICDHSQRVEPFFRVSKIANTYNVYSVCACPDGCDTPPYPPSTPSCHQIDSCTCKSISDNALINLHNFDNPYAPLTTTDNRGYTYYYNPCSGLKLNIDKKGQCDGVAGCQGDPYADGFYSIGETGPKITYNATVKEFTFLYTKGKDDRSFAVRMICDHKADIPTLATDGDISYGEYFYPLKLTMKFACSCPYCRLK